MFYGNRDERLSRLSAPLNRWLVLGLSLCLGNWACAFSKPEGASGGQSCTLDAECPDTAAGICDLFGAMGVCRQCTTTRTEACTGATPACGATNMCEACSAHSDCASDACLPNGSCAAETEVVYLRQGGSGTSGANCTKAAPCGLLETAIDQAMTTPRPYIRVTGTIGGSEETITGKQLVFLGSLDAADSILLGQGGGGSEPLLFLRGGAKVEIRNLTLRAAKGPVVRVDEGSSFQSMRSKIQNADEEGILISSGTAIISESEISGNGSQGGGAGLRRGISLAAGELTVTRTKIFDNAGGGIFAADGQKFTISTSFIVGNRGNGGVHAGTASPASKLEFNTIVDNIDGVGAGDAGGITCDQAGIVFSNNLIFRNTGGSWGTAQTFGDCTYGTSYVLPGTGAGDTSLAFAKDTAPRDYHLTSSSPATVRDVAGVVCTGLKDVDGDERPLNGACDLGADEYRSP